MNCELCLEILK